MPITVCELLQWAYQRQAVLACDDDPRGLVGPAAYGRGATAGVCDMLASGLMGGGIKGGVCGRAGGDYKTHRDAEAVSDAVGRLSGDARRLVVRYGVSGVVPDWEPYCEPGQILPVLRGNGRPRMVLCGRGRRPIACLIEYHGLSDGDAADRVFAARVVYADWWVALYELREIIAASVALSLWAVTGIGAERCPWNCNAAAL